MSAAGLLILLAGCGAAPSGDAASPPPPEVCIGEFMASNQGSVVFDGAAPDWIELHNRVDHDVSLDGWSLGDGTLHPFARGEVVPAGGVLVMVADDEDAAGHVPFKISADGETLRLVDPAGRADVVTFPPMPSDFVRRRLSPCCAAASCWRLDPDATPGAP